MVAGDRFLFDASVLGRRAMAGGSVAGWLPPGTPAPSGLGSFLVLVRRLAPTAIDFRPVGPGRGMSFALPGEDGIGW